MPPDEEFASFFAGLSPEEQQQFMYDFGMSPQQQASSIAGMPLNFDFGQDVGNIFQTMPTLTAKGAVDPYDQPQQASALNYTQDVGGSIFDMAQAAFAGPEAWSDPALFEPVTSYTGKPVQAIEGENGPTPDMLSTRRLDMMINNGGYEGMLAGLIKVGKSPNNAVAQIRDMLTKAQDATTLDPDEEQTILELRQTMPVREVDSGQDQFIAGVGLGPAPPVDRLKAGWADFDEQRMLKEASDLWDLRTQDEMATAALQYDPKTGMFYEGIKTEDSDAAKKFHNAGLATPFERFDDPAYIEKALQTQQPGYQNDVAAFNQDIGQQGTDWNALADEYRKASQNQGQLQQAWSGAQPGPTGPGTFQTPNPQMGYSGATPPVGRYGAANPQGAASQTMPSTTALGRTDQSTSQAQQDAQMEGALASQFRANPIAYDFGSPTGQVTPTEEQMAAQLEGSLASTFMPAALGQAKDVPVFFRGDNTAHLLTPGEGVRFSYQQPGRYGTLNQGDVRNAKNKTNTARTKATDAYKTMQKQASQGAPGDYARAYTEQMLRGQAATGMTPLQVSMLARLSSLAQRTGRGG